LEGGRKRGDGKGEGDEGVEGRGGELVRVGGRGRGNGNRRRKEEGAGEGAGGEGEGRRRSFPPTALHHKYHPGRRLEGESGDEALPISGCPGVSPSRKCLES
jgi:hypothetical protein